MTPPNLTGSALAAWHRSEADRIEAEERARRPALAAGQVWTSPTAKMPLLTIGPKGCESIGVYDGLSYADLKAGAPDHWEYVGPASTHLRVVPPDPPAPQVAPEPTGAALIGKDCEAWDDGDEYRVIGRCIDFQPEKGYLLNGYGGMYLQHAKPYVEGVAP